MPTPHPFSDFISSCRGRKIAIGMHRNADLDALCSAYALSEFLPGAVLATPDDMNKPASEFAAALGIKVSEFRKLKKEKFDGLIVVDCASYAMLEGAEGWPVLALIDHHRKSSSEKQIKPELEFCDQDSPSTAQIVSSLLPSLSQSAAFALAIGIISDTARFKGGNQQSFEEMARLLRISGKTYAEALAIAEPEPEADSKMAVFSAFQRSNVLTYKNFVIATTIVANGEGEASSSLSEFADIAFAASWRGSEKETRVSARARKQVPIALNEVMMKIGERFSGNGGGHAKAAGANAMERPEAVLEECVAAVKDALDNLVKTVGV